MPTEEQYTQTLRADAVVVDNERHVEPTLFVAGAMKIVLAPDSFKESMTATEAVAAMRAGAADLNGIEHEKIYALAK